MWPKLTQNLSEKIPPHCSFQSSRHLRRTIHREIKQNKRIILIWSSTQLLAVEIGPKRIHISLYTVMFEETFSKRDSEYVFLECKTSCRSCDNQSRSHSFRWRSFHETLRTLRDVGRRITSVSRAFGSKQGSRCEVLEANLPESEWRQMIRMRTSKWAESLLTWY